VSLGEELRLETQRAQIEIARGTARTKLTQTFRNPTNRTVEGTYLFPLPTGAAISSFAMTVNGKRVEAEILEGDRAREIYNGIVAKLRDPALLEFVDRNTVRARIFPIAARAEQQIEIEYSQPLSSDNGASRYTLPMHLPLGGAAQNSSVEVRVRDADARAAYSPTHTISNKLVNGTMQLSGEWKGGEAARDFVLYVSSSKSRIGLNIVTQQAPGEDPYFMLLAAPDPAVSAKEIAAKDVVFTFDTSGSMSGEKIEQARKALLNLLGNLNANDRFNIVTFSSDVNPFRDSLVEASTRNVEAARQFAQSIKAVGGTNIDEALKTSLQMLRGKSIAARMQSRPQQLVFMTDGQPTVAKPTSKIFSRTPARPTNRAKFMQRAA
jgi:Ca-activated chloride channel family protein